MVEDNVRILFLPGCVSFYRHVLRQCKHIAQTARAGRAL